VSRGAEKFLPHFGNRLTPEIKYLTTKHYTIKTETHGEKTMKKMLVLDRDIDPISLEAEITGIRGKIYLRIGKDSGQEGRGSRVANFTPKEARKLAIALLQAAEQEDIS
jgi:hypothetical protein